MTDKDLEKEKTKELLERLKALKKEAKGGHRVLLRLALSMFIAMSVSVLVCLGAVFISYVIAVTDFTSDMANVMYEFCMNNLVVDELSSYLDNQLAGREQDPDSFYDDSQRLIQNQSDASGFIDVWILVLRDGKAYDVIDTDIHTPEGQLADLDEVLPQKRPWAQAILEAEKKQLTNGWAMMVQGLWSMMVKRIETSDGTEAFVGLRPDRDWVISNLKFISDVALAMSILVQVVLLVLFLIFARKSISRPIGYLNLAAYDFAREADLEKPDGSSPDNRLLEVDYFETLPIEGNDEISGLHKSLIKMEKEIKNYFRQRMKSIADEEKIAAEFSVAASIQQSMLPPVTREMEEDGRYELDAMMRPARAVGGDFYDFFNIDEDHLALVIADVSDKGTPASMFMMMSSILIRERTKQGGTPAQILEYVNNRLCENNLNCMFVTVWLGIVELSTGEVIAANAGHEYPFIRGVSGQYELMKDPHGVMCGIMEGETFENYSFTLPGGGGIFVYTDGVAEALSPSDERFEMDRIGRVLNAQGDCSMKQIVESMTQAVDEFAGSCEQFDDMTMIAFRYQP